jgi:hypothetical protein
MKEEYKTIKLNEREFQNLKAMLIKEIFNIRVSSEEEVDEIKKKEKEIKLKEYNTLFTIFSYIER